MENQSHHLFRQSGHLKANATGESVANPKESIKQTNVCGNRSILAGRQELLLSTVKRRKLSWFGHVCRHDTLPMIILQGTVDGSRRRARPRKSWKDNIKEWTGQSMSSLLRIADDRESRSMGNHRSGYICPRNKYEFVVVLTSYCRLLAVDRSAVDHCPSWRRQYYRQFSVDRKETNAASQANAVEKGIGPTTGSVVGRHRRSAVHRIPIYSSAASDMTSLGAFGRTSLRKSFENAAFDGFWLNLLRTV